MYYLYFFYALLCVVTIELVINQPNIGFYVNLKNKTIMNHKIVPGKAKMTSKYSCPVNTVYCFNSNYTFIKMVCCLNVLYVWFYCVNFLHSSYGKNIDSNPYSY